MKADDARAAEAELIRGLRAGEAAAYRQLVEQYSAAVYGVALRLLGDEQAAEDVLQETFLKAFRAIARFQGRSLLSTWLYRIATNESLMRLRRREPTVSLSLDEPMGDQELSELVSGPLVDWSSAPAEQLLSSEARLEMDKAISDLPEALRVVFVLRDLQGLSGAETAQALGISVQAVKTRLHRARLWLRDRLSAYFCERVQSCSPAA